jgi:hypothetical protein
MLAAVRRIATATVAVSALATACLLGMSPDELGLTCRFAGDHGTACGASIAGSCGAAIDACCREPVARPELPLN